MTMLVKLLASVPGGSRTSNAYGFRRLPSSFVSGSTVTVFIAALKPSLEMTTTGRRWPPCSLPTDGCRSAQNTSHRRTRPTYATGRPLPPALLEPVRGCRVERAGRVVHVLRERRIAGGLCVRLVQRLAPRPPEVASNRLFDERARALGSPFAYRALDGVHDVGLKGEADLRHGPDGA